jgi:hypothetical protein
VGAEVLPLHSNITFKLNSAGRANTATRRGRLTASASNAMLGVALIPLTHIFLRELFVHLLTPITEQTSNSYR